MSIVFVIMGCLCLLVAAHPFTTYPWSLIVLQAIKPRTRQAKLTSVDANQISCAICVCAYNEERIIEQKIQNLLALREREPGLQLLVYVDCASDRTAEILTRYAHCIDLLHVADQRHGKTYGMNLLASKATADLLIFTDANVMMDMDCVSDFKRYFVDPEIGCVCGNLTYTNSTTSVTASSGSAYWRFEEAIKRLEAETGSMMGADGSVFAIRRALHQPPPEHLIDDMYVSLKIMCSGYRVVQADDAMAYEESVVVSGEEFKRKIRIACQAFNVHRLLWPDLRKLDSVTLYKYVSHKLIRWFTIYLLAAAVIFFEAALLVAGAYWLAGLLVAAVILTFALGYYLAVKPFAQLVDVMSAFTGAGLGVWRSLRGERYQTWTPAASIRR